MVQEDFKPEGETTSELCNPIREKQNEIIHILKIQKNEGFSKRISTGGVREQGEFGGPSLVVIKKN